MLATSNHSNLDLGREDEKKYKRWNHYVKNTYILLIFIIFAFLLSSIFQYYVKTSIDVQGDTYDFFVITKRSFLSLIEFLPRQFSDFFNTRTDIESFSLIPTTTPFIMFVLIELCVMWASYAKKSRNWFYFRNRLNRASKKQIVSEKKKWQQECWLITAFLAGVFVVVVQLCYESIINFLNDKPNNKEYWVVSILIVLFVVCLLVTAYQINKYEVCSFEYKQHRLTTKNNNYTSMWSLFSLVEIVFFLAVWACLILSVFNVFVFLVYAFISVNRVAE